MTTQRNAPVPTDTTETAQSPTRGKRGPKRRKQNLTLSLDLEIVVWLKGQDRPSAVANAILKRSISRRMPAIICRLTDED